MVVCLGVNIAGLLEYFLTGVGVNQRNVRAFESFFHCIEEFRARDFLRG